MVTTILFLLFYDSFDKNMERIQIHENQFKSISVENNTKLKFNLIICLENTKLGVYNGCNDTIKLTQASDSHNSFYNKLPFTKNNKINEKISLTLLDSNNIIIKKYDKYILSNAPNIYNVKIQDKNNILEVLQENE